MGQAERTKSAVASMPAASASGTMKSTSRKHGGPQLLRAKVAPAARDQGVAIGPRAGAGASFGAAAGLVAPERPEARVEVAKPAPAAAAQAFHAGEKATLMQQLAFRARAENLDPLRFAFLLPTASLGACLSPLTAVFAFGSEFVADDGQTGRVTPLQVPAEPAAEVLVPSRCP